MSGVSGVSGPVAELLVDDAVRKLPLSSVIPPYTSSLGADLRRGKDCVDEFEAKEDPDDLADADAGPFIPFPLTLSPSLPTVPFVITFGGGAPSIRFLSAASLDRSLSFDGLRSIGFRTSFELASLLGAGTLSVAYLPGSASKLACDRFLASCAGSAARI